MVMFIDDLNMPTIDLYGTQSPNALLKFLVEKN
jgi:dynein heavy chain, axonemal